MAVEMERYCLGNSRLTRMETIKGKLMMVRKKLLYFLSSGLLPVVGMIVEGLLKITSFHPCRI
jgi:hypothetical protein